MSVCVCVCLCVCVSLSLFMFGKKEIVFVFMCVGEIERVKEKVFVCVYEREGKPEIERGRQIE